jgi:hypothetical protein
MDAESERLFTPDFRMDCGQSLTSQQIVFPDKFSNRFSTAFSTFITELKVDAAVYSAPTHFCRAIA